MYLLSSKTRKQVKSLWGCGVAEWVAHLIEIRVLQFESQQRKNLFFLGGYSESCIYKIVNSLSPDH
jgi:hypothetical protein